MNTHMVFKLAFLCRFVNVLPIRSWHEADSRAQEQKQGQVGVAIHLLNQKKFKYKKKNGILMWASFPGKAHVSTRSG